jgi:hypothetical protein
LGLMVCACYPSYTGEKQEDHSLGLPGQTHKTLFKR